MGFRDIFDSDVRLPARICILAPGPEGRPYYSRVPASFAVCAVSKAVLVPGVSARYWVMTHAEQAWFDEANRRFTGTRVFSHDAMMAARDRLAGTRDCYYFKPSEQTLDEHRVWPVEGTIRYGATRVVK